MAQLKKLFFYALGLLATFSTILFVVSNQKLYKSVISTTLSSTWTDKNPLISNSAVSSLFSIVKNEKFPDFEMDDKADAKFTATEKQVRFLKVSWN